MFDYRETVIYFEQFLIPDISGPDPEAWQATRPTTGDTSTWGSWLSDAADLGATLEALTPVKNGLLAVFRWEGEVGGKKARSGRVW